MAKSNTAKVGKDVVGNDQSCGNKEPKDTGEDVADNEMGLNNNKQKGHMGNTKLSELESVVVLLERVHKENEANDVQTVGEETVMSSQGEKVRVNEDNMLEIVDDRLAFEEIDCCSKEIPVKRSHPRELLFA